MVNLKRFRSATITLSATRLLSRRLYWSFQRGGIFSKSALSFNYYTGIKRYLHISMPTALPLACEDWWRRLEALSSHLRKRIQELYSPSAHVAVDEMMVECRTRNMHTVWIPCKPIPCGFKVLALCDAGYTLNWLYTSRIDEIAGLRPRSDLTSTGSSSSFVTSSIPSSATWFIWTMPLPQPPYFAHSVGVVSTAMAQGA